MLIGIRLVESGVIIWFAALLFTSCMAVGFSLLSAIYKKSSIAWWECFCFGWMFLILIAWYAFIHKAPVSLILPIIISIAVMSIVVRGRFLQFWLDYKGIFLGFLIVAILWISLLFPQISPDKIPIFITGNNDIFNYANHALVLISKNPFHANNWIGTDLIDAVKKDVFGATVWLAIPSIFSGRPPIESATAAIVAASSVCGLLIFELYRKLFPSPFLLSVAATFFTLVGSGFAFVFSYYFLAQILFYIAFLGILNTSLLSSIEKPVRLLFLIAQSIPFYFVLFMSYPYLFFPTGAMHVLLLLFIYWRGSRLNIIAIGKIVVVFPLGVMLSIIALVPKKAYLNYYLIMQTAQSLRASDKTVSLLSIFGAPFGKNILNGVPVINAVVLFVIIAIMLACIVQGIRSYRDSMLAAIALILLAALCQYYTILLYYGQSYQLIKFATFYFVPLAAFVFVALLIFVPPALRNIVSSSLIVLLVVMAVFNYKNSLIGRSIEFSAKFRNITAVNYLHSIERVYIGNFDFGSVMLLGQYIWEKPKSPSSPSYYNFQPIDPKKISIASPVLIRGDCNLPAEEQISIQGGFTLIQKPPRVREGEFIEFDRDTCMRVVGFEGFSGLESGGRWTQARDANFKLMVDENLKDVKGLHLFIEMVPFLKHPSLDQQTVRISVDNSSVEDFVLRQREETVVKFPLNRISDDSPTKIAFVLPDSRSPASLDSSSKDTRQLGVFVKRVWIGRFEE